MHFNIRIQVHMFKFLPCSIFPSNYKALLYTKSFPFKIDVTRAFYSFYSATYALAFCVTNHVAEKLLCSSYNAYYSTQHTERTVRILYSFHECAKKLFVKCYRKITFPCTITNGCYPVNPNIIYDRNV